MKALLLLLISIAVSGWVIGCGDDVSDESQAGAGGRGDGNGNGDDSPGLHSGHSPDDVQVPEWLEPCERGDVRTSCDYSENGSQCLEIPASSLIADEMCVESAPEAGRCETDGVVGACVFAFGEAVSRILYYDYVEFESVQRLSGAACCVSPEAEMQGSDLPGSCMNLITCLCGTAEEQSTDSDGCRDFRTYVMGVHARMGAAVAQAYCDTFPDTTPVELICVDDDMNQEEQAPAPAGDFVAIGAGNEHSCGLRESGEVACWGTNFRRQIGNDEVVVETTNPVPVVGLSGVASLHVGGDHNCALLDTGRVVCWGARGRLGAADPAESLVEVTDLHDVTALSAGGAASCAIRAGGSVVCWGRGNSGVLGNGETVDSEVPVEVAGLDDAIAIGAGVSHICAVREAGTVVCWGYGLGGALGNRMSTVSASSALPLDVAGVDDVIMVAAGRFYSCALQQSGTVRCWGSGYGLEPVEIPGLSDARMLSAGESHICALREGGTVVCW